MENPRYWRLKGYGLRFEKSSLHPNPGEIVTENLPRTGTLYSYTIIERDCAPAGFEDQAPYISAIVRLDDGKLITTRLTDIGFHYESKIIDREERQVMVFDIDESQLDRMRVEMVTRRGKDLGEREIIPYVPSFRPVISSMEVSMSSK